MAASRQRRWEEEVNAIKERNKNNTDWQNDTEKLKRRDQVVVRLRTGYSRATQRNKMEGTPDPDWHPMAVQRNREIKTKE
jgi:hypothetical protein